MPRFVVCHYSWGDKSPEFLAREFAVKEVAFTVRALMDDPHQWFVVEMSEDLRKFRYVMSSSGVRFDYSERTPQLTPPYVFLQYLKRSLEHEHGRDKERT